MANFTVTVKHLLILALTAVVLTTVAAAGFLTSAPEADEQGQTPAPAAAAAATITPGTATAEETAAAAQVIVTIDDGSQRKVLRTAAQTVAGALQEAGVALNAADGVEPPPATHLTADTVIRVHRSFPLTINADGRVIRTRSYHTNVTDALAASGITLVGEDYALPGPDAILQPGDIIQVYRVSEDILFEDEPLPFQTLWQATDQLDLDTTAVISEGVPGILRRRIRVRYENGIEISRAVDEEWVAREPVNEVIGYGTHINVRVLDTPEGPVEYWRVVRMRVTSYTAASSGKEPGDPGYGVTASGVPAGKGIVAIDRNIVPFRSYVYVPGYGIGFAGDTGGGVRGRWIDLGYGEADFEWWAGYTDVYYLTPVPPPEDINYLLPSVLP
ncbi:MAG: ubiquitin-like domain-containing protein [Anaerolineae bacterium]